MIVLLKTRCGCQRVMEMPKGWMDYVIKIPLDTACSILVSLTGAEFPYEHPVREFRTAGDYDEVGRMVFTEVE